MLILKGLYNLNDNFYFWLTCLTVWPELHHFHWIRGCLSSKPEELWQNVYFLEATCCENVSLQALVRDHYAGNPVCQRYQQLFKANKNDRNVGLSVFLKKEKMNGCVKWENIIVILNYKKLSKILTEQWSLFFLLWFLLFLRSTLRN